MLGVVNPFKKAGKAYKGAKRVSRIVSKSRVSKKVARSIRKVIKPTRIKRKIRRQKIKTVHAAQRAKCKITKKGCFVAGTKIAVKNGFLPIEKIKAGDRVWSEDMRTGKKTLQKVKKIFVREKDSIVRLSINGEVTETTDEHPFFVKDIGWIPAGQLQLGDEVKLGTDDYAVIDGYEVLSLDEPIKVYNFEVAENHNYYVSKIKVLVHNGYEKGFDRWLNKGEKNYTVYFGVKKKKVKYTGITKQDLEKRLYQHQNNKKHPRDFNKLVAVKSDLTKNQARALEQYYMNEGFNKWNIVNSIRKKHPYYKKSQEWAAKHAR